MVLRAATSKSSLSFFAAAISSSLTAATSCWFLRKSCADSSRTRSSAAFISPLAASAAARSFLADSMASPMLFSRVSIIWRMGPQANLPRTTSKSAKVTNVQKLSAKLTSVRPAARTIWNLRTAGAFYHKAPAGVADYFTARMMQTTSANRVTPSMRAAAMIIEVRMSPAEEGWRAVPSMAAAARRPMPKPAPMTARPAPSAAARYPSENWFMVQTSTSFRCPEPQRRGVASCRGVWTRGRCEVAQPAIASVRVLRHPDEERGEDGQDVGLDEGDEQLEEEDAQREGHAHRRDVDRDEERQRDEEEDDDVARHHVGEEADGERERLGEEAEELDHEHQRPERLGHPARHQVRPVPHRALRAHAGDLRDHEGEEGQHHGNRQVACGGGDAGEAAPGGDGQKPADVHEEDEEERRAEIRRVQIRVGADVLHRDLVPDEHHQRLEQVVAALGDQRPLARTEPHHDEQDAGGDPHVDHVLGDVEADVPVARPEPERHHRLVLDVMEDVGGDALFFLLLAGLALRLVGGFVSGGGLGLIRAGAGMDRVRLGGGGAGWIGSAWASRRAAKSTIMEWLRAGGSYGGRRGSRSAEWRRRD